MQPRVLWLLAVVALAVAAGEAASHGDYDWIRKGKYKSPYWGVDCCGPSDCHPIDADRVVVLPEGYRIGYLTYSHADVLASEDGKYWGCGNQYSGYYCLFVPLGM